MLTLGREVEELFLDVWVDFYLFAGHDIADRRHTYPNELMLVEGDLADLIQDLLWRSCRTRSMARFTTGLNRLGLTRMAGGYFLEG